jgi:phage terminase small subunit
VDDTTGLNARQLRFALGVLEGKDATNAYIGAGYKARGHAAESSASKLLRKPEVQAFLAERRAQVTQQTTLSVAWVLQKLEENVDRAMTAVPVFDREGEPTGEYTYQGNVANKALELIGKHLGMWSPAGDGDAGIAAAREWAEELARLRAEDE